MADRTSTHNKPSSDHLKHYKLLVVLIKIITKSKQFIINSHIPIYVQFIYAS